MSDALLLFGAIYLLHIVPVFAPPTWMAIALLALNRPDLNPYMVAVVAASAAVCGRMTLARAATVIVRNRWMGKATRANVDFLNAALAQRKKARYGLWVFYLYNPASNYLFIAHGLTNLPLRMIAIPFFIGRLSTYILWGLTAQTVAQQFNLSNKNLGAYFGGYFVLTQLILLLAVWLFTRIDWQVLFEQRKLRLLDRQRTKN
ncbi:MAG TPA: hypothetical protein VL381_04555 [Rhodocyclaceae bacterium]|jgi:hypothetical protein|nr:hypothetical protein [Rhodocyclaceae bacterium]